MWELLEITLFENLPSDSSSQNSKPSVVRHQEFHGRGSHTTVVAISLDPLGENPLSCFSLYPAVRAHDPWLVILRRCLAAYFEIKSPNIFQPNIDFADQFLIADCKALVAEPYSRNDH